MNHGYLYIYISFWNNIYPSEYQKWLEVQFLAENGPKQPYHISHEALILEDERPIIQISMKYIPQSNRNGKNYRFCLNLLKGQIFIK